MLLNSWLEMVYIFHAYIVLYAIGRSVQFCSVHFKFLYVILEVLIEDWHGNSIISTPHIRL